MKIFNLTNEKKIIICAHQGAWGGNIPGNSKAAFEIAIAQGADMVELDVTASSDGELFVFHPTMEERCLGKKIDIRQMRSSDVKKLQFLNCGGGWTGEKLLTLDDAFEHLKGRCYINVDKFADNPAEIIKKIKAHCIEDQIVVKCDPIDSVFEQLETQAPWIQYLAIVSEPCNHNPYEIHEMLKKRALNYVGLEVVFRKLPSVMASDELIEKLHADGKLVWGNAIVFDVRYKLSADHGDDVALRGDPDYGWGWFVDHGFDIIQTDWTRELKLYLERKSRLV